MYIHAYIHTYTRIRPREGRREILYIVRKKRRPGGGGEKEQRGASETMETGWAKKCNNNPLTGSNAFSTGKLLFYFA